MSSTVDSTRPVPAGAAYGPPLVELDAPAAVLLVELASRSVVHANDVAEQLAPGVGLPAGIDAWGDAADLRDLDGAELTDTAHPLSLLTGGRPVAGQAVTAARLSKLGRRRAPLWVVGLPLSGDRLAGFGLVVLLPLRRRDQADEVVRRAEIHLRERALVATGVTFTIADAQAPDSPLLWVNPAFTTVTGYTSEEVVGRNCRFLQGPGTDPSARAQLREALAAGQSVTTTILNYRKDGSAFWNLVAINPVHDDAGTLTHFVGIQSDVTARVTADAERDRALAAEQAARADAVRAQEQLALLAGASARLASTLDERTSLEHLLALAVPGLADWAMVTTFDDAGGIGELVARHRDGREGDVTELTKRARHGLTDRAPMFQQHRGARAWRVDRYATSPQRAGYSDDPELLALSESLGLQSVMFVPLPGRRSVLGSMVLARGEGREPFTGTELAVAEDLGRRAGLTLDNVRLYEAEHHIAETLQRSLLPELPAVDGLEFVGRYRAGAEIAEVGGDFYDVVPLTDGTVGVCVGDVVGHDLAAAAAMGHLRGLLRACAWDAADAGRDCADVVARVDRMVQGLHTVPMATLVYATLGPPTGTDGAWTLAYSSAGHPPMLLRHPDGRVETLDAANGLLLGVEAWKRSVATVPVPAGSLLLAYTDGLVERRGEDISHGLDRVRDVLAAARPGEPGRLCDRLLAENPTDDDTAVLAIQVG
ncbi:SpoIIE family protein phosphatase [Kineosporia sp. A_224]|uniref:SpoIIE family protein phosphatase n=1 Tax=Kineosporia sp. A_224 TaxID=1962180 RepID=UPI00117B671E|nr:SpoIIE family protein phosphatase [Kineosporia sp. A_224]